MYPATIALICCALCTYGGAMDSESMELQTKFLTGIYETVKERQLEEGELNLLQNQSAGFANAIRSFSEKGIPKVIDGNRAMMFNLSMLTEPQVFMQLAIKIPSPQYFQSVRHLHLYTNCSSCMDTTDLEPVAHQILPVVEKGNEWLELTLECPTCDWEELDQVFLFLQQTDENDQRVAFTEETATDLKLFLIVYTYDSSLFPLQSIEKAIEKRRVNEFETNSELLNRTTVAELRESNVTCSRHEVLFTAEELHFEGRVIAPFQDKIQLTYCLGECSNPVLISPEVNKTYSIFDSRTRTLMYSLNNQLPPCCIPNHMTVVELIVSHGEYVELETVPHVVDCKCQL